ncbi:hypothetical protein F5Y15DRAFT_391551 [Xylariaceae sp. FL0016]|nr:hypothetical protein F5Y15DRAFT_391551 [Xylariaceae sp. FL0016]
MFLPTLFVHLFDLVNTILLILVGISVGARLLDLAYSSRRASSAQPVVMNRRGGARIPLRRIPIAPRPMKESQPPVLKNIYEPSSSDCGDVKRTIARASQFPPEIVDMIMDFAEYWTCSTASIDYTVLASGHYTIRSGSDRENQFLLRTEPIGLTQWHADNPERWRQQAAPRHLEEEYTREELEHLIEGPKSTLEHPIRKVVFQITSRDQGHGGNHEDHNTFRHSFTWFDAGIDRFDKTHQVDATMSSEAPPIPTEAIRPVWPPLRDDTSAYDHQLHADDYHLIQCNRLADKTWQHYCVEWYHNDNIVPESSAAQDLKAQGRGAETGNGEFVRNLKVGDMITVWGRSRFGGWQNNVQDVEIRVYWAL